MKLKASKLGKSQNWMETIAQSLFLKQNLAMAPKYYADVDNTGS